MAFPSVLGLKKNKPHPIRDMLPIPMFRDKYFGISGVSCHGCDINNKEDIDASRRYNINAKREMQYKSLKVNLFVLSTRSERISETIGMK